MAPAAGSEWGGTEESELLFVDSMALAGVVLILVLRNCSKLFTSY